MERLETKQVKGHTYYYYSKWEWVQQALPTRLAEVPRQTRRYRRRLPRERADSHLRRGLPVGIVPGPLAGSGAAPG